MIQNERPLVLHNIQGNFDSPVDRAGVNNQNIFRSTLQFLGGQTEQIGVFAEAGQEKLVLPLGLDTEHHNHVRVSDGFCQVMAHLNAQSLNLKRDHGGWSNQSHVHSHGLHGEYIGAHHPTVRNVAHDDDPQSVQRTLVFLDGQKIEKSLGRVLVRTVTSVNYGAFGKAGDKLGRSRAGMSDHNDIRVHRLEVAGGIDQVFPLDRTAG